MSSSAVRQSELLGTTVRPTGGRGRVVLLVLLTVVGDGLDVRCVGSVIEPDGKTMPQFRQCCPSHVALAKGDCTPSKPKRFDYDEGIQDAQ